jgi:hypothetical protein
MINSQLIKVIIILVIVAFSIPTFLMIYGDFKTMAEPVFDESLLRFGYTPCYQDRF